MNRPLTKRQRAFIETFIQLAEETQQPIHYSHMSRQFNVSLTTAYEMLRTLERKGLVTAHYVLEETGSPGRSSVLFLPTDRARLAFGFTPGSARVDWTALTYAFMSGNRTDVKALIEVIQPRLEANATFQTCFTVVIDALQLTLDYIACYDDHWTHLRSIILSDNLLSFLPGAVLMLLSDPNTIHEKLDRWSGYHQALQTLNGAQQEELITLIRSSLHLDERDDNPDSSLPVLEDDHNDERDTRYGKT